MHINHFLAQHPRLCKFIFGTLYFAASIFLIKDMGANHWGTPVLAMLISLIAFDVLIYFCIYSLINPTPDRKDLRWDYKVWQRKRMSFRNVSLDDFVSYVTNGRKFIRIIIIVGMVVMNIVVLRDLMKQSF
ncbi:hypothetical protein ACKWWX_001571 [Klebsiella oxytoca]